MLLVVCAQLARGAAGGTARLFGHPRRRLTRAPWPERPDATGATATPGLDGGFRALPAGGFARGGVRTGHVDNSAHYEGRAIDVFFRPIGSAAQRRLGWVFAQWVVAHAERHHVLSVIYSDHIWTSWASSAGFVTTCTRVDRRETRCCATSTTCTWRWRAAGPFGRAE